MSSAAHRAAVAFLQGGLAAVVAQVVGPPIGGAIAAVTGFSPLAGLVRTLLPVAGFSAAGAVGGDAVGAGPRAARAFAGGGALTGLVLTATSEPLSGLTGYENPAVVIAYAVITSTFAYGVGGALATAILRKRTILPAAAFAAGGAAGGVLGVLPFLLSRWGSIEGAAGQLIWVATAIGSVLVPLACGGALTARALDGPNVHGSGGGSPFSR